MPPANTPTRTPPTVHPIGSTAVLVRETDRLVVTQTQSPLGSAAASPTHQRPLTPLSYLSSPVPDLAATLFTQAADDVDEANVSFLRDSLESLDSPSPPMHARSPSHSRTESLSHARRLNATSHPAAPIRDTLSSPPQLRALARNPHALPSHMQSATDAERPSGPSGEAFMPETTDDLSRRERLQRVLSRLNRLHDPAAASTTSAYTNRTPSPHRQSLYDWAPGNDEHSTQGSGELDAILHELRRQQPETLPDVWRLLGDGPPGSHRRSVREGNGTPAPPDMTDTADRRDRIRDRRRRDSEWVSLRTRAAIQRSRQGSPSATDRMLRYVLERERSGVSEEEERAQSSSFSRPTATRTGNGEENRSGASSRATYRLPVPASSQLRERDRQERVEAFRRGYLAENVPTRLPRISTPPVPLSQLVSPTKFLESALCYLSQLRECSKYEDALSTAMDHGLATKEFFADKHDDFIMDLGELNPLQESSWLQPGVAFEGHQHAATCTGPLSLNASGSSLAQLALRSTTSVEQINPNFSGGAEASLHIGERPVSQRVDLPEFTISWNAPSASIQPAKTLDSSQDHWPVRVVLHAVDPTTMTVQGTMEAYDVPQLPVSLTNPVMQRPKAGKKTAPITTYVEGHIIDLATHSFLTPSTSPMHKADTSSSTVSRPLIDAVSFPAATAQTDAANWRKLPPFSELSSPDEVARIMLSKARLAEVNERYIFMRWKERCFVHSRDDRCSEADRHGDQDRGHGLTISGFYYISLCREDGAVEGLYFDPSSAPYQHLHLRGKGSGWPAFEMR